MLRRQVRTRPEKIQAFFQQLAEMDGPFMAILEVCGFNDWLIEYLRKWNCPEVVLIHPEKPGKWKTDRRDAQKLADLLWLNRERLAEGQTVHGLRRVYMVSQKEREDHGVARRSVLVLVMARPCVHDGRLKCCNISRRRRYFSAPQEHSFQQYLSDYHQTS